MFGVGWQQNGLSHWAVRLGNDQALPGLAPRKLVGTGGVHLLEANEGSPLWKLGYRIAPECWGHGFATELACHGIEGAHACRDKPPVVDRMLPLSPASLTVAQRAGLRLRWEGRPSPSTVEAVGEASVKRLILAGRELGPEVLHWPAYRG